MNQKSAGRNSLLPPWNSETIFNIVKYCMSATWNFTNVLTVMDNKCSHYKIAKIIFSAKTANSSSKRNIDNPSINSFSNLDKVMLRRINTRQAGTTTKAEKTTVTWKKDQLHDSSCISSTLHWCTQLFSGPVPGCTSEQSSWFATVNQMQPRIRHIA
jgi:hypothetical protein